MRNNKKNIGNKGKSIQCVISYSHKDRVLMDRFKNHLEMISKTYPLEIWLDEKIKAGTALDPEIEEKFHTCDILFILVSVDYINSDYCYRKELKMAYDRHNESKCVIVPVILSDVKIIDELPFGNLKRVPKDGQPIKNFKPQEKGLVEADGMIIDLLKDFKIDNKNAQIQYEINKITMIDVSPSVNEVVEANGAVSSNNQVVSVTPEIPKYEIVVNGNVETVNITQEIVNAMPKYFENLNKFNQFAEQAIENAVSEYKKEFSRRDYKAAVYLKRFQLKMFCDFLFKISNTIQQAFIGSMNTRIHFRRLYGNHYRGIVVSGIKYDKEKAKNLTEMPSNRGMIYMSGVRDKPLLRSYNNDLHVPGQHDNEWVEYLTCTFKINDEFTPILSMGISLKKTCLENCQPILILMAYTRFDVTVKEYILKYIESCKEIDDKYVVTDFMSAEF